MMRRLVGTLALSLALSGCISVRDYEGPPADPIDEGSELMRAEGDRFAREEPVIEWWRQLGDEQLNTLIENAFANNRDRAAAEANLRAARAALREARRGFFPDGDVTAAYTRQVIAENAQIFGGGGAIPDFDLYDVGFDAVWEFDLFGRISSGRDAARADFQATIADRDDLLVSLAAETASAYVALRGAQQQLAVAERNAENQRESRRLTEILLEGGRGTRLDTERARAQLDLTLATIPTLRTVVDQNIFRLSVLTGQPPAALLGELSEPGELPAMPELIAVGDASGLLRRRPDIRRAERELAAATAEVGVIAADLFPTVSIVGSGGYQTRTPGNLIDPKSFTLGIGPQLIWNILDFGRVRARVDQADELSVAAAARYEQTVLLALEEAEASLSAYGNELQREELLRDSAVASGEAARLARLRYQNGVDDFLEVLDAERVALENETLHVVSQTETFTQLIAIYKALGGGWQSTAAAEEAPPSVDAVSATPEEIGEEP